MESNGGGWLADSMHAVDNNVKQLLKLIEDKNLQMSSAESVTEDKKMPDIAIYLANLHSQYHLLAERYSQLVKEHGKNVHELDENLSSPFYTPVSKFTEHKPPKIQAVGSDSRLSDLSYKNGFGSSSTSLTDSDLENSNLESLTNDGGSDGEKKATQNREVNDLLNQIEEYEKELLIANTKGRSSDEDAALFQSKFEDNEVVVQQLKGKLDDAHASLESISMEKSKVSKIERTSSCEDELSKFSKEAQKLKGALADTQNMLLQKDAHYQSEMSNLMEQKKSVESEVIELKKEILEVKSAHDAKEAVREVELKSLRDENMDKTDTVETLSKYIDALKLKYDMANASLETLTAEMNHKIKVIQQLNERISHLTSVNTSLNTNNNQLRRDLNGVQQIEIRARDTQKALIEAVSESDRLNECIDELRARVSELEKGLEEQQALVAEGAKLKREAIRQLCISLEHYRTEYLELREAVIGKKRMRTDVASHGPSS